MGFGQFFNDLHDLNRLWTVRDLYGHTASLPIDSENFFARCDLAAGTREFATAAMDFRAIFAGFRAVGLAAGFESLPER
ncbi:MAG: hypothetical protein ACJA1G_000360 [Qipengyuania sp.]